MKKNVAHVFRNRRKNAKKCAKGKILTFLSLPRELRDIIISYSIDYDGIDSKILEFNDSFPSSALWTLEFPVIYSEWMSNLDHYFSCTTPTILLLNHQVNKEAQEILEKKILRIANPPQYPFRGQFVLSRFISSIALEDVQKAQFVLRTYPADIRKPNDLRDDWKGKDLLTDERLADSYPWAMLLKECFDLWRGTQQNKSIEIFIDHCSGGRSEYHLSLSGNKVLAFEKCIDEILVSQDLDALVAYLTFAHVPIEFE